MISFIWYLGIFINLSLMVSGNNMSINNANGCFTDKSYVYKCCETIEEIKGTVCFTFAYLPNDYGVSFTITYNNHTLFNETISARNPPPICVGIPELENISAGVCLILSDLTFGNKHFHGCVSLKVYIFNWIFKQFDFECFDILLKRPTMFFEYSQLTHNQNSSNSPEVIMIP